MVWQQRSGLRHAGLIAGALLGALALAGCTESAQETESAACGTPTVSVQPASATAGGEVVVTGENFLDGCPDRTQRGTVAVTDPAVPYTEVQIRVLDNGGAHTLAVVDAADDGTFEIPVPVPDDLGPGVMQLTTDVDGTQAAELVIGIS